MLLLIACSGDSGSTDAKQPAVINVYVFAPDKPIITRGDIGEVDPINNDESESKITTLQIWVFEHNTENLISYYSPESVTNLNNDAGATYQLSTSNAFTDAETKPKVDVYVVANVTSANSGISLDERTTRTALEAALIEGDYFGLNTLTYEVPEAGLPMSGVLRGVSVTGSAPVYKISNVTLTRAVSKIRFVFSREKVGDTETDVPVKINSIKLDASMIPTQEYLFLETGEDAPAFHVDVLPAERTKLADTQSCMHTQQNPHAPRIQVQVNVLHQHSLFTAAEYMETPDLTLRGQYNIILSRLDQSGFCGSLERMQDQRDHAANGAL